MDDNPYGPPEKQKMEVKVDLLKFLRWWKKRKERKIDKSLNEFYKDIDKK